MNKVRLQSHRYWQLKCAIKIQLHSIHIERSKTIRDTNPTKTRSPQLNGLDFNYLVVTSYGEFQLCWFSFCRKCHRFYFSLENFMQQKKIKLYNEHCRKQKKGKLPLPPTSQRPFQTSLCLGEESWIIHPQSFLIQFRPLILFIV